MFVMRVGCVAAKLNVPLLQSGNVASSDVMQIFPSGEDGRMPVGLIVMSERELDRIEVHLPT
jgi:hypothetical protein